MSYRIEQKNGNRIYVYEATNHWDPKKKRPQQTRVYLGVKDPKTGDILTPRKGKWRKSESAVCGVIHAVETCSEENHLKETLNQAFGSDDGERIFGLAAYCATEGAPMYLYENWAHMVDGMSKNALSSQTLSDYLHRLGSDEKGRSAFWRKWADLHGKNRNLVFDLTSISTYSTGIEYAEWGRNRDGESLPQINLGMVYSDRPGMPLGYKVYPGSVGDVTTLKNLIHYLKHDLLLSHSRMVLDRGFFSESNIRSLDAAGFDYLIPVPSGRTVARGLFEETENSFQAESEYFEFNNRLMAHAEACREYAGKFRKFHIFLDFDRRRAETQLMLSKLKMAEDRFSGQSFASKEDATAFIESICPGMSKLFTLRKTAARYTLQRDSEAIHSYARKFGKIILLPENFGSDAFSLLTDYSRRDGVEKFFDTLKNEMDSGRGRVQSQETFDGRLFVHMIGLIIYGEMMNRIRRNAKKLKCKLAFPEIVSILKRLKRIHSADGTVSLSELTAKQRMIFNLLEIPLPQ